MQKAANSRSFTIIVGTEIRILSTMLLNFRKFLKLKVSPIENPCQEASKLYRLYEQVQLAQCQSCISE